MTIRGTALVLQFLLAIPAAAGVNRWTESAPPRRECSPPQSRCSKVAAIALDPFDENVMYALMTTGPSDAPDHGLWRSEDGGATWTRLSSVLTDSWDQFVSMRVSAADPRILYILSRDALHRSADGGHSWVRSELPEWYMPNTDFVLDIRSSNTVYVAQERSCLWGSCIAGGVYRSDDGGRRWRRVGLDHKHVWRLANDPTHAATFYAIVEDRRLFQTTNGGGSWKDITPPGSNAISMVIVDPVLGSTVYATTGTYINPQAGIFKSTDRGRTWRLLEGEYLRDGAPNVIAIDALHPLHLLATSGYGSVIRSVNGGETWSPLGEGLDGVRAPVQLVIAPSGHQFHAVYENGFIYHYTLVYPRRRAVAQ